MSTALLTQFHEAYRDPCLAVLEGFHPLKHARRFGAEILVACTCDRATLGDEARRIAPDLVPWLVNIGEVAPDLYARLARGAAPEHVIAIARKPVFDPAVLVRTDGPVILLEQPSHLGNVGAVIRVAAAADAAAMVTLGGPDPWHPAALRGSAGLHFALAVGRITSLRELPRPLIAIDPEGAADGLNKLPGGTATFAFGSEAYGLTSILKRESDQSVAIPMRAGVSSLNLATSVAIVLYANR